MTDCAICLDPLLVGESIKTHPGCGIHRFHKCCFQLWVKMECPFCRMGGDRLAMIKNETRSTWGQCSYIGLDTYSGNPIERDARSSLVVVKDLKQSVARVLEQTGPQEYAFVQLTYRNDDLVLVQAEIN
jgi:hypothetical protein